MERLFISCEELGIELGSKKSVDVYIVTLGDAARKWGLAHLPKLRDQGLSATMDYKGRSMKSQMKDADRENARYAIIVGDHELESGKFTFRDMKESEEEALVMDEILSGYLLSSRLKSKTTVTLRIHSGTTYVLVNSSCRCG